MQNGARDHFDTRGAAWTLRVAVGLATLAAAWVCWVQYSELNSLLFTILGTTELLAHRVDRVSAVLLALCALLLALKRSAPAAVLIATWFAVEAVAMVVLKGRPFPELAPAAHATRFLAPLAALAIHKGRIALGERTLRWAIALTFTAHGVEAIAQIPAFLDLLLLSARRFGISLTEAGAGVALMVIGWLDLVVAVLVVLRRSRFVAGYMAAWGAVTLGARVAASGLDQVLESIVRLPNAAVPAALFLLWSARDRVRETNR